jgi:hypothetical protein
MNIEQGAWAEVVAHYEQMAERIPRQAASLTTL